MVVVPHPRTLEVGKLELALPDLEEEVVERRLARLEEALLSLGEGHGSLLFPSKIATTVCGEPAT